MTESLLLLAIVVFLAVLVIVLTPVFVSLLTMSLFNGPYFAGTSQNRLTALLQLAAIKPGQKLIDLGSGDGRIVIAAASAGAKATGLELNPWFIFRSRLKIRKKQLKKRAEIISQSFWEHDLSKYDLVVIYGISHIMKQLEQKLAAELKPGAKFISVYFQLPGREPDLSRQDVHLYQF